MIQRKFHRLLVVKEAPPAKGRRRWECVCECGAHRIVIGVHLRNGNTKSCGCLQKEKAANKGRLQLTTHGGVKFPEYGVWSGIKERCYGTWSKDYPNYGGRGIHMCERWRTSFSNFYQDMGSRPSGTTIDRVDNDGPYSPENCRWASKTEQQNNKRNSVVLEIRGRSLTIAQWAREVGIPMGCLWQRVHNGWDLERAITQPRRVTNVRRIAR